VSLDRLSAQPREVHRIRGELGAGSRRDYDAALERVQLDLVLLGIGADGHTASLFPDQPTLDERSRRAVPAEAKLEPFVDRVTLTVPALCSAPEVMFLVTGEQKAEAVERAVGRREARPQPDPLTAGGRTPHRHATPRPRHAWTTSEVPAKPSRQPPPRTIYRRRWRSRRARFKT
jgi:hypothetical protein